MKQIVLCADDYGQNSSISQAIIDLLIKKRLSAVSCMTSSATWLSAAEKLKSYHDQVDIGLHFNLTEEKSLGNLIIKSHLNLLDQNLIATELYRQLDRFEEGLGRSPDFMDGHQHVHQLPYIRDVFLKVYKQRFPKKNCYIRNVNMPFWAQSFKGNAQWKRIILQTCGTTAFKKQLLEQGIPHNRTFSGMYDFAYAEHYPQIFPFFLKEIQVKGIIMCHPGYLSNEIDPIAHSRVHEFQFFSSEQFIKQCETHQFELGRFTL